MVESKESNQGLLSAVSDVDVNGEDIYYIAFDYVVDNQDIRNKYRMLKSITDKSEGKIVILDMICFEYLILAFDKLVEWTGTGKIDKIKIREEVLAAVENHRINLAKISDEKTLQYIADFKRYSTERVQRGFCIGKKNWEMIDTINGATSSAIIYSIAETAKANNLKPYEYFEYLLIQIPAHMDDTDHSFWKIFFHGHQSCQKISENKKIVISGLLKVKVHRLDRLLNK